MDIFIKNEIKSYLEKTIRDYLIKRQKKLKKERSFHVLDYLFPTERRIRSLIGGMETSMGTKVWELSAELLARHNNFEILDNRLLAPDPMPIEMQNKLAELERLRKDKRHTISMKECVNQIQEVAQHIDRSKLKFIKPPSGTGIDLYISKNGCEYAFDIKTAQPNRGDGARFNRQLLDWYIYRYCKDPLASFEARIAIPFNPYITKNKTWWESSGAKVYPLMEDEVLVEDEFWSFLSDENDTWQEIHQIFFELGEENFGQQFNSIFYSQD
ncbi:MAG: TdeIII family type II restriction endonuclease [Cyanobacteria bacterium P01_E01_bin.42]